MGLIENSEVVKSVSGLGLRGHERQHGPCVGCSKFGTLLD